MNENNLAKIAVSSVADEALSKSLERINQSFDGGRVTKTELTSWYLLRSANTLDDAMIDEIHKAHFDQVVYLENLVKKMKASGRDSLGPEELSTLQAMLGQQTQKKRHRLNYKSPASNNDDKI